MSSVKDNPIHVLLVEDNPGDARLVEIMMTELQDGTFKVTRAERFSQALEILAETEIDAILLDLGLPDSSGLGTASRMVAEAPNHPIVVLTGLDDESVGMEAVHQGVQDYLVKGQIEGPLVRRAIRYAIDRHAAAQVLRYQLDFQQQMIDALPTPMFYADATLMVLGCNQAFEALTGLSRRDVLGGFVYEVLPEGLAGAFDENHLGTAGTAAGSEVSFENADGSKLAGTVTHTAFTDTNGKVAGLVVCLAGVS